MSQLLRPLLESDAADELYGYVPGTSDEEPLFTDKTLETEASHPVDADASTGRFDATYRDPTRWYELMLTDDGASADQWDDPLFIPAEPFLNAGLFTVADGETDNLAGIQRAVDIATSVVRKQAIMLWLPAGTWRISGPIRMRNRQCSIYGAGPNYTTIKPLPSWNVKAGESMIDVDGITAADRIEHSVFQDFQLRGLGNHAIDKNFYNESKWTEGTDWYVNRVYNGYFGSSSGWTFGTGWSFDGTNFVAARSAGSSGVLSAGLLGDMAAGAVYRVQLDIIGYDIDDGGSISITLGGGNSSSALSYSNICRNGDFTQDTRDWVFGAGWSHDEDDDEALHTAGDTEPLQQRIRAGIADGEDYWVRFDVTGRTAGQVSLNLAGSTTEGPFTSDGSYSQKITAGSDGDNLLKFTPDTNFDGAITNVIVYPDQQTLAVNVTCGSANDDIAITATAAFAASVDNIKVLGAAVKKAGASTTQVSQTGGTNEGTGDAITENATYYCSFQVRNRTAGTVAIHVGGAAGQSRSTNGYFNEEIVAGSSGLIAFSGSADFDGEIVGDIRVMGSSYQNGHGLRLNYGPHTILNRVQFGDLASALALSNSWNCEFNGMRLFDIRGDGLLITDQTHSLKFNFCTLTAGDDYYEYYENGAKYSCAKISGDFAQIKFDTCAFDGPSSGPVPLYGVHVVGSSEYMRGLNLVACYGEKLAGPVLRVDGDASNPTRNVNVVYSRFTGSKTAYTTPDKAIRLRNVEGFNISDNAFDRIADTILDIDSTCTNGLIARNGYDHLNAVGWDPVWLANSLHDTVEFYGNQDIHYHEQTDKGVGGGAKQRFGLRIKNDGGTIKHAFGMMGEAGSGKVPSKVTGSTTTFTTTPKPGAMQDDDDIDFAGGACLSDTYPNAIVFDTDGFGTSAILKAQFYGQADVVFKNVLAYSLSVRPRIETHSINNDSRQRLMIFFYDEDGDDVDVAAALTTDGDAIEISFDGWLA